MPGGIDQAAASLWYHPHLHGTTAEHVYRGVSGMFILGDDEAEGLALWDRGVTTVGVESLCFHVHRNVSGAAGLATVPLILDEAGARTDELRATGLGQPY